MIAAAKEPYSALRHHCWATMLNHSPDRLWLALMTEFAAYFDDSGHPDDQVAVVVGGLIASERQWLLFEKEWREILEPMGIEAFHMTDFERCKIWSRERKDAILRRLVSAIRIRTRLCIS